MSNVAKLKKRALDYEQKKQFDKALDTYMQVLGALGDHVEEGDVALFNRVGDLLLRQGNVGAAVDHYERAVDLYTDGGFHNNAIALCSKILRNAPGRNSIYYKLGRISARKGFTSDAKTNFLEYADRMQRIGQVDEAFRALKEFADLCPDQDDIRLMLAEQLVRAERKEEALEQLQLHYDRLLTEGRSQEAKATLDRIRAIDPAHQPKTGVARPTPKANDLIFIDVGFDMPGANGRPVTGSMPAVPAADAAPSIAASDGAASEVSVESPSTDALPLIDIDGDDDLEIAPVDGLSTGSVFDADSGAGSGEGEELSISTSVEPVAGFEETSLGAGSGAVDPIAPLAGIEQSAPLAGDDGTAALPALDTDPAIQASATEDSSSAGEEPPESDAELPVIDISLDLIDDGAPGSGNALTLIFPEGENGEEWDDSARAGRDELGEDDLAAAGAAPVDESALSTDLPETFERNGTTTGDELRIEPLLQLPELETPDESIEAIDGGGDLPLIALGEEEHSAALSLDHANGNGVGPEAEESGSSVDLHFLDLGDDHDLPLISRPDDFSSSLDATPIEEPQAFAGAELESEVTEGDDSADESDAANTESPANLSSVVERAAASVGSSSNDEPTLADLRTVAALNSEDWEARRRLGEALLEAGERREGLAELERAMLTLEQAGDVRGASAMVNELIRVEPHEVRFHQKRVEYAVRSGERGLLADAYYSLAESLFQMGEIEKSRAVYSRVLELSPGDARARAALQTIDDSTAEQTEAREVDQSPSADTPMQPSEADQSPNVIEPTAELPRPRPRDAEPEAASLSDDFVNLADWLDEEAPERNTRMVVDVKEPEIEDQVDFAEMLAMFKQGVAANVDEADHEAHYDLGVAYKEMGLLDEAISEFQKALRGTGNRARTYEALGQCFVERGQHQIAVTILSRALGDKSYTDDMLVGVLYLLGYASESLGRWADAQRFYERVFAVDIEFRDIANRLAVAERGGK